MALPEQAPWTPLSVRDFTVSFGQQLQVHSCPSDSDKHSLYWHTKVNRRIESLYLAGLNSEPAR
jgi:hypothetical protein